VDPPPSRTQPAAEKRPKRPGMATRGRAVRKAWHEVRGSGVGALSLSGVTYLSRRGGGDREEQEGFGAAEKKSAA
jgi:hypothetical protein